MTFRNRYLGPWTKYKNLSLLFSLLSAKKLDSVWWWDLSSAHASGETQKLKKGKKMAQVRERDCEKWAKSGKGESDKDFLTSVLYNRQPLAAELPAQKEQSEPLGSVTQIWGQSFSLLLVLLLLLSLVSFPAKAHTSQVCKWSSGGLYEKMYFSNPMIKFSFDRLKLKDSNHTTKWPPKKKQKLTDSSLA